MDLLEQCIRETPLGQCLSLVGSPDLATGSSNSVEGVRQLNRLYRLLTCLPRGDAANANAQSA